MFLKLSHDQGLIFFWEVEKTMQTSQTYTNINCTSNTT